MCGIPGIEINLTNYSVLLTDRLLICRQKNWNFFISSHLHQIRYSQESSSWISIWGYEYIGDTRTVDVHIKRLREKIKDPMAGISAPYGESVTNLSKVTDPGTGGIMKSTFYLKFIVLYIIFGFLSVFTAATLTQNTDTERLEKDDFADIYQEANLVADNYLPLFFQNRSASAVHTHSMV